MNNKEKYDRFYYLIDKFITFKKSMSELSPNTQRMYHRKHSAAQAIDDFVSNMISHLSNNQRRFVTSDSADFKKYKTSNAGIIKINKTKEKNLVTLLNRRAKECSRLVFFEGAIFEATCNVKKIGVMNTQTLIMLDVPSEKDVANKRPITLYASKPGSPPPDRLYYDPAPSEETVLKEWGWKKVVLDVLPENFHSGGGVQLYRQQYPLTHPGASTASIFRLTVVFGLLQSTQY